ncbi:MAG: NUDIX domain-containing protein, partial [Nitrospira sp.]|nr:NUDIX domain-containing protein [Nitrospira sp.]
GGIRSVGVLTGYNASDQLHRAGPDRIVEHLGELQEILEVNGMELQAPGMATSADSRRPIVTVGAAVLDEEDRVLMVRTHKWSNRWGIPGGKVKFGEGSEAALSRELKEETDLDVRDIEFVLVQDCIHSKEFYRDEHFVLLNYRCRVASGVRVRLNEEAQEYRWVSLEAALAMDINQPTRVLLEALRERAPSHV